MFVTQGNRFDRPQSVEVVNKVLRHKLRQSEAKRKSALGHDYGGLTFHPRAQAAAHSNPVPLPARFTVGWTPERITRAPLRRITYDRGSITRTLGNGLGVVVLSGTGRPKAKSVRESNVEARKAIVAGNKARSALHRNGFSVPKSPSWKQEVAGWSLEYRIDRGAPCLFDHCRAGGTSPKADAPDPYMGSLRNGLGTRYRGLAPLPEIRPLARANASVWAETGLWYAR